MIIDQPVIFVADVSLPITEFPSNPIPVSVNAVVFVTGACSEVFIVILSCAMAGVPTPTNKTDAANALTITNSRILFIMQK